MTKTTLKIQQLVLIILMLCLFTATSNAQYKDFKISSNGDTLNIVDTAGLKQGRWVNSYGELRGEPGYEEEGYYEEDKKTGSWRKYTLNGDIIAAENYLFGGKEGQQEYFSFLGNLERHEEWRGYNPDTPYDTIAVYGSGNNEIVSFKIVKAAQYSVPHGDWKFFDQNGHISKYEKYERGRLINNTPAKSTAIVKATPDAPKEKVKTKEILEYEKKYSKKKRSQLERAGKTSL